MKHFIDGEGGASSLLASLFERDFKNEEFWRIFKKRLHKHGISLTDDAPELVKREYENLDLVVLWSDWLLVWENKVARGSIYKKGQLTEYYDKLIHNMPYTSFLKGKAKGKKICIIYITPGNSGKVEFESLKVDDPPNKKIRLSWSDMIEDIEMAFNCADNCELYNKIVLFGCQRVKEVIKEKNSTTPKSTIDEKKHYLKSLLKNIELKIRTMMENEPTLKMSPWEDAKLVMFDSHVDGRRETLSLVLNKNTSNTDDKEEPTVACRIQIAVGRAKRVIYRDILGKFSEQQLSVILGVEAGGIKIDGNSGIVKWEGTIAKQREEIVDALAGLYCRFVYLFRNNMSQEVND